MRGNFRLRNYLRRNYRGKNFEGQNRLEPLTGACHGWMWGGQEHVIVGCGVGKNTSWLEVGWPGTRHGLMWGGQEHVMVGCGVARNTSWDACTLPAEGEARRGAATGDNNVFRYSYVNTLYLTHYKRSGAGCDERSKANRSRNSAVLFPQAATKLGKFPMKIFFKKVT